MIRPQRPTLRLYRLVEFIQKFPHHQIHVIRVRIQQQIRLDVRRHRRLIIPIHSTAIRARIPSSPLRQFALRKLLGLAPAHLRRRHVHETLLEPFPHHRQPPPDRVPQITRSRHTPREPSTHLRAHQPHDGPLDVRLARALVLDQRLELVDGALIQRARARARLLPQQHARQVFTRRPSLERRDVTRGIAVRERPHASTSVLDVGDSSRAFLGRDERGHDDKKKIKRRRRTRTVRSHDRVRLAVVV